MDARIKSMLAWLIMAALCGLFGFLIVYYYASQQRPNEHFAIVIDAGSTQTRSSLYQVTVHTAELAEWLQQVGLHRHPFVEWEGGQTGDFPLANLLQARQVSSCVNGGPLASITSPMEASRLMRDCLIKFTNHIKLLDFVDTADMADGAQDLLDADEVSRQLALTDHRVTSLTHIYLGATAGMRALEQMNETKAREKLGWVDAAIGTSNQLMLAKNFPYLNKGFVGIINGSDEATFGWISVNFVCDTLAVRVPLTPVSLEADASSRTAYQLGDPTRAPKAPDNLEPESKLLRKQPNSIGTLELGGASAQMAFQVANNELGSNQIRNMSLEEQNLTLFNGHYRMATRSDMCLGMSQAVLRLNYVVLHRKLANYAQDHLIPSTIRLENECLQKGAILRATGRELIELWSGTCLLSNNRLDPLRLHIDAAFRARIGHRSVEMVGTGQADQCDSLLDDLIEPARCKRYFSLCPTDKNLQAAPHEMPFVTVSGFNHALNVLGLARAVLNDSSTPNDNGPQQRLIETIDNKLGGGPIDYDEFVNKTSEFCTTDSRELLLKYPKVNKKFQDVICLQLIYIKKLLIQFYRFEPSSSWSQIKFLIFAPKSLPSQFSALKKTSSSSVKQVQLDARRDIGWTLGLLLNATSQQLSSSDPNQVYFHHGASVMYIIRATIFLMLACCLVAIGLLVIGVLETRQTFDHAEGYISHSSSSSSSYDVSYLSPTPPRHRNTDLKATGLRYVLSS